METTHSPVKHAALRDRIASILGAVGVTVSAAFLMVPAIFVVLQSFSGDAFFVFPPRSWGLRQYETLFQSEEWTAAVVLSLKLALVTAGLSALIVIPAVFALHRSRVVGRAFLQVGGLSGIIIPLSAYAVALYGLLAQVNLTGTFTGLVIANITIAAPAMLLVSSSAMSRMSSDLELASMVAGAPRWRALVGITGRLMLPGFCAGAVLAFVQSFDESVFVVFVGGPDLDTLPKAVLESARTGVDPTITAVATMLMVVTTAVMLVALRLARRDAR